MIFLGKINGATLVVAVILLAFIASAIAILIRNKRNGKSSCGGDCSRCMSAMHCNNRGEKQ